MSPKEIIAKFGEVLDNFEPIDDQPSDADLVLLREVLTSTLLQIPCDETKGKDNLVIIIADASVYLAHYSQTFTPPARVGVYDKDLKDNEASAIVRSQKEAEHKTKCKDRRVYKTAWREMGDFILHVVKDTWLRELKNKDTFYTLVEPKAMLDHLQESCMGKHLLDLVKLQNEMQQYHLEAEGIPEYINMLEDAQERAKRANKTKPITDKMLLTITSMAMLATQRFPRTVEAWEDLDEVAKTWPDWKKAFKKAAAKARVNTLATEGLQDFGANAASPANRHDNPSGSMGGGRDAPPSSRRPLGIDDLNGYFDNLAAAATNEKAVLEQLVANNTKLVDTNEELVATNKKLTGENWQLQQELNSLRKKVEGGKRESTYHGTRTGTKSLCPHCKRKVFHKDNDCFKLNKNASNRPAGWKSCL